MADVHHVISLGIGSPADIAHLTLVGLSPTGPVAVAELPENIIVASIVSLGPTREATFTGSTRTVEFTG